MRIGEAARQAGVGVETIRFYETKGLIDQPPTPRDGGYRDYPETTVRRIRFVRNAQQIGFSLKEIVDLLALNTRDAAQCSDVRAKACAKLAEVDARIENLGRIRSALEELIEACPGEGPARECSILEAINTGDLLLAAPEEGGANGNATTKD